MTKDAAILAVAVRNALEVDWFCPLINGMCRKQCLCYCPSRLREYKRYLQGFEYQATEPYCANQMFFRECSHNT